MSKEVEVPGINRENAQALLDAAQALDLDVHVVRIDRRKGAFVAPEEVVAEAGLGKTRAKAPGRRGARSAKKAAPKAENTTPKEDED